MDAASIPAPAAESVLSARLPFRGFAHLGGLAAGLAAGVLATVIPFLDEKASPVGVGLCVIGGLNTYLLSLLNRKLSGMLAGVLGGFILGFLSYELVALFASDPAQGEGLAARVMSPLLFAAACPFLGAGPIAITIFFQEPRPRGTFLRLFLGVAAACLAGAAGVVMLGGYSLLFAHAPAWSGMLAAFMAADYLLFRLQVLFLLESAAGDEVRHPGSEDEEPAQKPGPDDEP